MDEENARTGLEELNERILETLFSSEELTIAVDFTVILYSGGGSPHAC